MSDGDAIRKALLITTLLGALPVAAAAKPREEKDTDEDDESPPPPRGSYLEGLPIPGLRVIHDACPKCKRRISRESRSCPRCGANLR